MSERLTDTTAVEHAHSQYEAAGSSAIYPRRNARSGITIDCTDGKSEEEIQQIHNESVMMADENALLNYSDEQNCFEIRKDTPLSFTFLNNKSDQHLDSSGFCIVLRNGTPIPAWKGSELLAVNLSANELRLSLPMDTDLPIDDFSYLGAFYFEQPDVNSDSMPQIFMQRELYHVME